MVKRGDAVRVAPGVVLRRAPSAAELVEVLAQAWPDAVLDGRSALQAWAGWDFTLPIHVVSKRGRSGGALVIVRRSQAFGVVNVEDYRTINPLQALDSVDTRAFALAALEEVYAGKNGLQFLERHEAVASRLTARARELLGQAAIGADSVPEREVVRDLKARGLKVQSNYRIGDYRWDIVVPRKKVAVEIDGFRYHSSENTDTFFRDRWKGNDATLRGYTVLRYTGACVKYHREDVVRQIVSACLGKPFLPAALWRWHVRIAPF